MQAPQAVMLVVRAVTLRSAQLPQRMAVVAGGLVLLLQARGVVEAASVLKVRQHLRQQRTVEAVVVAAALLLVSVP